MGDERTPLVWQVVDRSGQPRPFWYLASAIGRVGCRST